MTSPASCIAHTWGDFSLIASVLALEVLLASALAIAALFVAGLWLAALQLVSIWPPLMNSSGCRFFRCTRLGVGGIDPVLPCAPFHERSRRSAPDERLVGQYAT